MSYCHACDCLADRVIDGPYVARCIRYGEALLADEGGALCCEACCNEPDPERQPTLDSDW